MPEMARKWPRNGLFLARKWPRNGPEMAQKCPGNGQEMTRKRPRKRLQKPTCTKFSLNINHKSLLFVQNSINPHRRYPAGPAGFVQVCPEMKDLKNQITYVVDFFDFGKWAKFSKSCMYLAFQEVGGCPPPPQNKKTSFLAFSRDSIFSISESGQNLVNHVWFMHFIL